MPTIEITQAQQDRLNSGKSIVIEAPEVKHFIVVRNDGGVLEYDTIDGKPQPWSVIRPSRTIIRTGEKSGFGHDFRETSKRNGDTVTEVSS